jgi:uncharacterized protein YodC (DUF2158 family)
MSAAEPTFSIGGLVQLKSGGPNLTIRSIEGDGITVEWFEGEKLKKHSFLSAQLQLVPEKKLSDLEIARRIAFVLRKGASDVPGFNQIDANDIGALIDHVLKNVPGTEP